MKAGFLMPIAAVAATLLASVNSAWAESKITKTADGIEVYVDAGVTNKWPALFEASGLTTDDCSGLPLIKKGLGAIDIDGYGVQNADLKGVYIEEGQYIATSNCEFGRTGGAVYVRDGATLILDGSKNNDGKDDFLRGGRIFHIAGFGTSRQYPAVRIEFTYSDGITWYLDADAAIYGSNNWNPGFARYGRFYTNGHDLTLDGISSAKHIYNPGSGWHGGGDLILRDAKLLTGTNPNDSWSYYYTDGMPQCILKGTGSLTPSSADIFRSFPDLVFEDTSGIAPSAAIGVGVKYLTGIPSLNENVSSLEITNKFTVASADFAAEKKLQLTAGTLKFIEGCELKVSSLPVSLVKLAGGSEYVLAEAQTIEGTPTLTGVGPEFFTLSNTGTELKLVRKADTRNYVEYSDGMDLTKLADNDVVLIVDGEYNGSGTALDLSTLTAKNVIFRHFGEAAAKFTVPVTIGAAEGLTLDDLTISGTAGPAVVANGASKLTLKNLKLKNVAGAWTDGHNYPYAFTSVTDLMVTGCTYAFETAAWDAQGFFDGGTQNRLSAVQAGTLAIEVPAEATLTWAQFIAANGLKDTVYSGSTFCKVGGGEFDPDGADLVTIGLTGLEVREGCYRGTFKKEWGAGARKVTAGGTMIWDNTSSLGDRFDGTFVIAGTGSSPEYPAVRFENDFWGKTDGITWMLSDDATLYAHVYNASFACYPGFYMNDHFMTLTGKSFSISQACRWYNGGGFVIENGCSLSLCTNNASWKYALNQGTYPKVILKGTGSFKPANADAFNLFKNFEVVNGGSLAPTADTAIPLSTLKGIPILGAHVTALTINNSFTLYKRNVKNGNYLVFDEAQESGGAITFGENATIAIDEIDADMIAWPGGTSKDVAMAGTITGTPTLTGVAADFFTVQNSSGVLSLVRKEHSENYVVYTDELDFSTLAEGDVVVVSAGDYRKTAGALDLSSFTIPNVTIKFFGEGEGIFNGGITVGAVSGLTIEGITIAGTTGPAVVANGATTLTLKDIKLRNVAGAWTDEKNYPFAFTDVTDLMISGTACVDGSTSWDAQAYLSGGSQLASAEVRSGANTVYVAAGATRTWAQFVADAGLKAEAYANIPLYKVGAGKFDPAGDAIWTANVKGIYIQEGQYVSSANREFGAYGGSVTVASGATLIMDGGSRNMEDRVFHVAGTGTSAEYPAVRWVGAGFGKFEHIEWHLDGDTTIYCTDTAAISLPHSDIFAYSAVYTGGHTLTLNGAAGAYIRMRQGIHWHDAGKVVVGANVRLIGACINDGGGWISKVYGEAPQFEFQSGSIFEPSSANIFNVIKKVKFANGVSVLPSLHQDGTRFDQDLDLVFDEMVGLPAMSDYVTKLTINNKYTALNADLIADSYLNVPHSLAFGSSAIIDVDSAANISGKTAFTAAGAITGQPSRSDTLKSAGLTCEETAVGTWSFVPYHSATTFYIY